MSDEDFTLDEDEEAAEPEAVEEEAVEENPDPAEPEPVAAAPEAAPKPVRKRGRGAVPEEEREPYPTWGYNVETGEGVLFKDFCVGDKLPDGYVDSPAKCKTAG